MNNLEELKQELKKLENKINELENKGNNKYKRKRLKRGEIFWYLDEFGEVGETYESYSKEDDFNYNVGNYFKTKEQAENYIEKLLIEQELKDIALELNKGEEIDWEDNNQYKYYLYYNFESNKICSIYGYENIAKFQGAIYCLDKNFKHVAIKRIGQERLAKYLKGELD